MVMQASGGGVVDAWRGEQFCVRGGGCGGHRRLWIAIWAEPHRHCSWRVDGVLIVDRPAHPSVRAIDGSIQERHDVCWGLWVVCELWRVGQVA
jgi:hypothetical protein